MANPQTIVITGGNTGLGYECAKTLAAKNRDWTIVIASRNKNAAAAAEQIKRETGNRHSISMGLDLASLNSVRAFAAQLVEAGLPRLHGLVCNAGIQIVSGTTYTKDGFETTFGVNHLGHFLLVNLLLPHMQAGGRIAVVASGTHNPDERFARLIGGYSPRLRDAKAMAYPERFPDPSEKDESAEQTGRHRYGTSKLCNVLFTYELARRLKSTGTDIAVNAFDPGLMPGTGLAREASPFLQFMWQRVLPMMNERVPGVHSYKVSGANLARLVDDPALAGVSGFYFDEQKAVPSSAESYDQAKAWRLWEQSAELVRLGEDQIDGLERQVHADAHR